MRSTHALPLVLLLLPGCYHFTPVAVEDVPPGSSIRAHLSSTGVAALGELPAVEDRSIEGTFGGFRQDALLLQVSASPGLTGYPRRELSQRVRIPRRDLVAVELKRLDRMKTVGVAAFAAGAVVALAIQMFSGDTRLDDRDPPPGGPVEIRVPLVIGFRPF